MMLPSYGAAARYYNIVAAIVVTMLAQWSQAKSVDVGGTAGWTSFESNPVASPNYGAWASSQKFYTGDSLVFKFAKGAHNVWMMQSRDAYQKCDFSGASLLDEGDSGFYSWKATQAGEYYFSCDKGAEGVGTHCDYNQKLAVVVSKLATTPTSAPSLPPTPNPNPPASSPSPKPNPIPPVASPSPKPNPITPASPPSPLSPPPPVISPAPWIAPARAPTPLQSLPPTKPPILAPSSSSTPIPGPWHSPVPVLAPVLAPALVPVLAPILAPALAPVLAPAPVAPAPVPLHSPAPVPSEPTISPVPAQSISPSPSPEVPAPSPSSPVSSPPNSALPNAPGGEPTTSPVSPSQNGGMFLSAQSPSSLLPFVGLLCVLLW